MRKIIISLLLLSTFCLTACNQTLPSRSIQTSIMSEEYKSSIYYLKTIDKNTIYPFIESIYFGEPKLNDTTDQIYHRVRDHIDVPCNGYCILNEDTICIEYGNINNIKRDGTLGKDNVCKVQFENYKLYNKYNSSKIVKGNYDAKKTSSGTVFFHIYNEERANQLYQMLCNYIDIKYPNKNRNANNKYNGYAAYKYINSENEYIAAAYITFDTKLDGWVVYYTVNFEPIKVINNIRNSPTPEVDESAEVDPYEDGVYH